MIYDVVFLYDCDSKKCNCLYVWYCSKCKPHTPPKKMKKKMKKKKFDFFYLEIKTNNICGDKLRCLHIILTELQQSTLIWPIFLKMGYSKFYCSSPQQQKKKGKLKKGDVNLKEQCKRNKKQKTIFRQ